MHNRISCLAAFWMACAGLAQTGVAQQQINQNPVNATPANPVQVQQIPEPTQVRPTYVLGPTDQMMLRVRDVEELNERTFRVEQDGTMTLPLIGAIQAAGRTVQQLQADIVEKLKTLVRDPLVLITVTQFRTDPVFFYGAFQKPGVYSLEGRTTLVDMLIKVGGLQANASRYLRLTRRQEAGPIPLPGALEDPATKTTSVDISMPNLSNTLNPAEDIVLAAGDLITATKSEKIYVQGAFNRTGVLELDERESLSAMQVITMSGGFSAEAEPSKAQILRPVLNTARRAVIPIDLKRVMSTRGNDYPLLPNDVLYVPAKKGGLLKGTGKSLFQLLPLVSGLIFFVISRI